MRPVSVLLAAAALLALTACSAEDYTPEAKPSSVSSSDHADAEKAGGIPPAPTGADRATYLAAIKAVDPALTEDEEKAIDAGRNQCSSINGGGVNLNTAAAMRFGNDAHELTDEQGAQLNAALRATLCPE